MKRLSATPNRRISYQPRLTAVAAALLLAGIGVAPLALPTAAYAAVVTVANPICPINTALFNPDSGQDIVVPPGFKVSVFKAGLNFPTGIAFRGNKQNFEVYVLESGHGSACSTKAETCCALWRSPPQLVAYSRPGLRSTSPSSMACRVGGCSPPIPTRQRTRITDRTTAHAL